MIFYSLNKTFWLLVLLVEFGSSVCRIIEDSEKFTFIRNTSIFIDKTYLLKRVLQYDRLLVTAPRKFGKSTNMQMIKLFLNNNNKKGCAESFFNNTNIWRDRELIRKHFCNYPVIYFSFKPQVHSRILADITSELQINIKNSFEEHRYLIKSTKLNKAAKKRYRDYVRLEVTEFSRGLRFLSDLLHSHHGKKVVILIDDYDHLITQSIFSKELELNKVAHMVFNLINETLNENLYLERAIVMGAVPLKSELSLLEKFKFMESKDFSPYFGFTESETEYLLDKFRLGQHKTDVAKWYGGYNYLKGTFQMYNPWSVLMFIKTRKLLVHWVTEIGEQFLLNCIKPHFKLHQYVRDMVKGKNITYDSIPTFTLKEITKLRQLQSTYSRVKEDYNVFVQLLLESGYLTYARKYRLIPGSVSVNFPNKEIWSVFQRISKQLPVPDFSKIRASAKEDFRERANLHSRARTS